MDYAKYAKVMKALSDPKRVKILDLLSCGTLCACDVLEHFDFTQPTLSHHIKVLVDAGLVTTEKDGLWHNYSINHQNADELIKDTMSLLLSSQRCVCLTDEETGGETKYEKVNAL